MNKNLFLILFFLIPSILLSQNIDSKAIRVFSDIENRDYISVNLVLDDLIMNNPKPEFYLAKAKVLYNQSKYNEALTYCEKIEKIKPYYASELKVKIFLQLGDKERSKLALEENIKSNFEISMFDLLESEDYSLIYQLELDEFILSENLYSRTEKQLYQVEMLISKHKYDQALFILNEMLSRNPDIAQSYYLRSRIEYLEGNTIEAIKSINSALNIKKSDIDFLTHRIVLNNNLKEYSIALQDINKLIGLDKYNIDNYIIKADLLFKTNQFDDAIDLTNSILEILPEDPDILYLSGKSHYMKNSYFDALKAVNQSLQVKSDKYYFELRADVYLAMNTYEFAIKDYSMFLDIEPYNGNIYAKKGLARLKMGDKNGACSDWEKGKRYESKEAIKYLEKYCK